jgi:hypothetical protein
MSSNTSNNVSGAERLEFEQAKSELSFWSRDIPLEEVSLYFIILLPMTQVIALIAMPSAPEKEGHSRLKEKALLVADTIVTENGYYNRVKCEKKACQMMRPLKPQVWRKLNVRGVRV